MPSRCQTFSAFPWQGGINTSVNEALIAPGELTQYDNGVFDFQFSKKKREGVDHDFDDCVFTVDHRSSAGTTRSLTGTFVSAGLGVGDKISLGGSSNTAYNLTLATITSIGASTLVYTGGSALTETSTAETDLEWSNKVIGGIDYWVESGGSTTQHLITVLDNGAVIRTTAGVRTRIVDGGTAWTVSTALTQASCAIFNNKLIVAVSGANNKVKYWDATTLGNQLLDLPNAPYGSIVRAHQGRLLMNDKTNLGRWHWSETGDHTVWQGAGDSGAGDIGIGDGDPEGITGISPTFKGDIFIGKRTKIYRIRGFIPDYFVEEVSNGIGFLSHNAIAAADQDDLFFVSDRGVHSMNTTQAYGAFLSTYISQKIQRSFVEDWTQSRKKYIQAAYLAELNSMVFAVSDVQSTSNNALWFFNIPLKAWFRWTNLDCEALISAQDADRKRVYLGGGNGRLSKTLNNTTYDIDSTGSHTAIVFRAVTGLIFPDQRPDTVKGFKKVSLIYTPEGNSTITAGVKIDNFSTQSVAFDEPAGTELLGTTFTLGTSVLGATLALAPYMIGIDGIGRGFKFSLIQSGINDQLEIQGFSVEYQVQGGSQETRLSDTR